MIQAVFDLNEWPACKDKNEESSDVTWSIKVYSSETLALIKDTDKEDREKALKASWETEEPGRAEKAKLSRNKFLLKKRLAAGETLTEEEMAVVNEKRERLRKKDQEDAAAAKGAKGGKAPPAKGGKADAKAVVKEEVEAPKIVFPKAEHHYNNEINSFLQHFQSDRKIVQSLPKDHQPRKRSDSEKKRMHDEFESTRASESESIKANTHHRDQQKAKRQHEREEAFKDIETAREEFKTNLSSTMEQRNKYRDGIDARKAKENALLDLIAGEKADINALKNAIEAAKELRVNEKYINRGRKFLQLMEYVKEFET